MFLELAYSSFGLSGTAGFKCSYLRAHLFTVLRVVYTIVRPCSNICHSTLLRTQHEVPFIQIGRVTELTENGISVNVTNRRSRVS